MSGAPRATSKLDATSSLGIDADIEASFRKAQEQRRRAHETFDAFLAQKDSGAVPPFQLRKAATKTVFQHLGNETDSEKSISPERNPVAVAPTLDTSVPWTIPGRGDDRAHRSRIGDAIIADVWRKRVTADANVRPRYHIRRDGKRFGEPLALHVNPESLQEPRFTLPPAPDEDDVALEHFRLESFFSDVEPERTVTLDDARNMLAEDMWYSRPKHSFWEKLYRAHWEDIESRVLAAPNVVWRRRRLAVRLLVAGSIFDPAFAPTRYDEPVKRCDSDAAIQNLWRSTLRSFSVLPPEVADVPVLPPPRSADVATSTALQQSAPTSMKLHFAVRLTGLDLTVIFESDQERLVGLQRALQEDIYEALRPHKEAPSLRFFNVDVERLEHGGLVRCVVRILKSKQEIDDFEWRLTQRLEAGAFRVPLTRDVLLNFMGSEPHGVFVVGAAVGGGVTVPPDLFASVPVPPSYAPLSLSFNTFEIVYTGRTTDVPITDLTKKDSMVSATSASTSGATALTSKARAARLKEPPTFLELVWRSEPRWESQAHQLPCYGSEQPKDLYLPAMKMSGVGAVIPDATSPFRANDGSVLSPGLSEFFTRQRVQQ